MADASRYKANKISKCFKQPTQDTHTQQFAIVSVRVLLRITVPTATRRIKSCLLTRLTHKNRIWTWTIYMANKKMNRERASWANVNALAWRTDRAKRIVELLRRGMRVESLRSSTKRKVSLHPI